MRDPITFFVLLWEMESVDQYQGHLGISAEKDWSNELNFSSEGTF